jgi:pimeloyl-ACP methyl ester carboxylesterase
VKLHTTTVGTGPRHIALVHGLGADGASWQDLVDVALATGKYSITSVDLRGHGESARASDYLLEDFVDDLVETLPTGLDNVVGHSLGGILLISAVARLRPKAALYLDPAFQFAMPYRGVGAKIFWGTPGLIQLIVKTSSSGPAYNAATTPHSRKLLAAAGEKFDSRMHADMLRQTTFARVPAAAPTVPSTILLSADGPKVMSNGYSDELAKLGWEIRRDNSQKHLMYMNDVDRNFASISDVL